MATRNQTQGPSRKGPWPNLGGAMRGSVMTFAYSKAMRKSGKVASGRPGPNPAYDTKTVR